MEGVAEVASVGGFVRQYQVNLDPTKVLAYRLSLPEIIGKIRMSNSDVGGRVVEFAGVEYMIRGRGYITSTADIAKIAVGVSQNGTPILLRDVASVQLGPDMRRGLVELDGQGEVVGGIVIMLRGERPQVIERIKAKLQELDLPAEGVKVVSTYDRSDLIRQSIATATENLAEELIVVSVLIVGFLLHIRSALIPILTLPLAVLISFIPMYLMGVGTNIMSIGGIIVAIGDMVDAAIIMVDNAHKRLEEWERNGRSGERTEVLIASAKEVGPAIFASLLVIAIAFMPVFTLEAQEGRMFKPLAFTKNMAIAMSAVLAITLIPALLPLLIRGRIISEHRHPVSRLLHWLYAPVLRLALRFRVAVIVLAIACAVSIIPALQRLGSEFMPLLYEGDDLVHAHHAPRLVGDAGLHVVAADGPHVEGFPEVERVFGKVVPRRPPIRRRSA